MILLAMVSTRTDTTLPNATLFRSLDAVQRHLDGVAHGHVDLAFVVTELFDRHDAFGLESSVDDDHVGADVDHGAADDGAGLEIGQIGRAHVCTPVTNVPLVCRLLSEKYKTSTIN